MIFNLPYEQRNADYKGNEQIQKTPAGFMTGWGTTTYRDAQENWAPGAIFRVNATAVAGSQTYVNQGTKSSATWVEVGDAGAGGGFALTGTIAGEGSASITLEDSVEIVYGTGSDVKSQWDGTSFNVAPSSGMWANCPLVQYADGFKQAYEFYDDFLTLDVGTGDDGMWDLSNTGGTAVLGAAETSNTPGPGGYVTLAASTTDEDWAMMKLSTQQTGAPWKISASGKAMWYEVAFTPSSTTTCSYMVGLISAADTEPITDATGAENSITDGIYWHTVGGTSTTVLLFSHNDGTEVDVDATAGTLAANTEIVLGFYFDGTTLTPYVNGVAGDTVLASATNFPNAAGMTPFFSLKTHGTSNAIAMHVDYIKCVQLR